MIPKKVHNPLPTVKSLTSENRLKEQRNLDWDSPSSYTGTVKRRPQSLNIIKDIVSPSTFLSFAPLSIDNGGTETSVDNDNDKSKGNCTDESLKSNDIKNIVIEQRRRIVPQEIAQGNCNLNDENKKGNETSTSENDVKKNCIRTATLNTEFPALVIRKKISKLAVPTQLSPNGKFPIKTTSKSSSPTINDYNQAKLLLFRRTAKVTTTAITKNGSKITDTNKQSIILTAKNDQVQELKGNSASTTCIAHTRKHQENQKQTSQKLKDIVATATDPNVTQQTENKYKLNEFHKKKKLLRTNDGDVSRVIAAAAKTDDTSKKYFSKQLPQGNKLKLQYCASSKTTTPTAVFTELYRDFPVNYASTSVVKSIPFKPPPYCNPPSPSRSSLSSSHSLSRISTALFKQTQSVQIDSPKPENKFENEIKKTKFGFGRRKEQNKQYVLSSTASKLINNTEAAVIGNVTIDSPAHRIANEFRLKSNFALQKLTNISKINSKNLRLFSSLESPNEYNLTKESSTAIPQCKHNPNGNNADERETLNDYMLYNSIQQNTNNTSNGDRSDGFVFMKMMEGKNATAIETMEDPKKSPPCDMLAKPEFTSSLFKNIPVRPRKGVPHLENYCLFDPSKDFVNEKELRKTQILYNGDYIPFPIKHNQKDDTDEELIEEIIYEDHLKCNNLENVTEESECGNYFTIDPDYIEHNKIEKFGSLQPIVESDAEEIYNDGDFSAKSIAKSNVEMNQLLPINNRTSLKKSPQIDKIFRHSSLPTVTSRKLTLPLTPSSLLSPKNESSMANDSKPKKSPLHLALHDSNHVTPSTLNIRSSNVTLKHSVSSPQLNSNSVDLTNNCILPLVESNYVLFHPAPVPSRTVQYKIRHAHAHARPLSAHSDADSGFLSPVTPPEAPPHTNNNNNNENATNILVLQQCDSIQGLGEVSTA